MKKALLLSICVAIGLNAATPVKAQLSPNETIRSINIKEEATSLSSGLIEAKKQGKEVLLYATRNGCPYCEMMEEDVLPLPEVVKLIKEKYIFVKLTKGSPELVGELKPLEYPSFYIITPNNKVVSMLPGYKEKAEFLDFLKKLD